MKYQSPIHPDKPWHRSYLEDILQTALNVGEYRFARKVALAWLTKYPGDLPVNYLHARAIHLDGNTQQALSILETLVKVDPEYMSVHESLTFLKSTNKHEDADISWGCVCALSDTQDTKVRVGSKEWENDYNLAPIWAKDVWETRRSLSHGKVLRAQKVIQQALGANPPTPLVAITHLLVIKAQEDVPKQARYSLAEHYHKKWSDCLHFDLLMADALMDGKESEKAVALIHKVTSKDVTGQIASRLWGQNHRYLSLWPLNLEAHIDVMIPAKVASFYGWNQLPKGKTLYNQGNTESQNSRSDVPTKRSVKSLQHLALTRRRKPRNGKKSTKSRIIGPETLQTVQKELEKVADRIKRPLIARSSGRFPIYVALTSKKKLEENYGLGQTHLISKAMKNLIISIRGQKDWGALLLFIDDPKSLADYGLKPVKSDDAWAIKHVLADLDKYLENQGSMIGALLIVGDPSIIPFHHLPNPTDDFDMDVPSDNPYSTRGKNYFVPDWPVGRLPGGKGNDASLLIRLLEDIAAKHLSLAELPKGRFKRWWRQMKIWLRYRLRPRRSRKHPSFGYTAEAWRKASMSVFRPIGEPRSLITSPPIDSYNLSPGSIAIANLGYFNLHGLIDSSDWYGQRDPIEASEGENYPIAFKPEDIVNSGRAPEVVFSEACYGTNIFDKSVEDAIALKFLASGCQAVVGSTVISYGSVTPPLHAADLLGKNFWKFLQDGFPVGEALRRAKVYVVQEMHQSQGYLDGEDQKTLISFVLYGDPLAFHYSARSKDTIRIKNLQKVVMRPLAQQSEVKMVCDRASSPGSSEPIPQDILNHVNRVVEHYLPGMTGANLSISHENAECLCEGHQCPTNQLGQKSRFKHPPERKIVVLSKKIRQANHIHHRYARLTLDKYDKVVKLAVSR